ncbi:MAG: DNA methyltransferase [Nanoarchaeota archaeon]
MYVNYTNSKEHPCEDLKEMINFILKEYFKPKMKVSDPFMGIANFGAEIIRNGGFFYGYEIVEKFFNVAKKKLEKKSA